MRRNTLIKVTFWINTGIFFLSCYVIAKVPEGVGFAACAFMASLIWFLAYVKANFFEESVESRRPAAATTSLPDAKSAYHRLHHNTGTRTAQ